MSLFDKRLVVVGGKGGVGRTTVAAALAVAAVRKGKRVLLCQTKSKERLSSLFDVPRVGTDLVRLRDRLWGVNMTPQAALREYGAMVLRSEFIAKQVLENKVSRSFLRAVPGLEDYAMLGKTWFHTTEEDDGGRAKWDLVILDGPLTGPAASTLSLLRDPLRSALVLVTLAEDLPSNEAVELKRKIDATVKMPWGPLVVNLLYPPRFATGPSARAVQSLPEDVGDPELQPLVSSARTAQRRRALNDRYLERLKRDVPLPQVHLPYLFTPRFDYAALEELSRRLEGQVAAAPEVTAAAVGEK